MDPHPDLKLQQTRCIRVSCWWMAPNLSLPPFHYSSAVSVSATCSFSVCAHSRRQWKGRKKHKRDPLITQVLPHHQGKQHVLPFTLLSYVTLVTQFGGRLWGSWGWRVGGEVALKVEPDTFPLDEGNCLINKTSLIVSLVSCLSLPLLSLLSANKWNQQEVDALGNWSVNKACKRDVTEINS